MSRGGRGGARGGILKGTGWEDQGLKLDSKPSELFPPRGIPYADPLTDQEKREVANFIHFRDGVHQGSLYTKPRKRNPGERKKIYSEDEDNGRYSAKNAADFDPFNGVPTYSMKYEQKQRSVPLLAGRTLNKEFFPKELWPTIDGKAGKSSHRSIQEAEKRKQMLTSGEGALYTDEERRAALLKLEEGADENDLDEDLTRDPDDLEEEEVDDDYEGAEGEMGGDYDAEQYFDNGEDEDDGDDGGGGGDRDGDY